MLSSLPVDPVTGFGVRCATVLESRNALRPQSEVSDLFKWRPPTFSFFQSSIEHVVALPVIWGNIYAPLSVNDFFANRVSFPLCLPLCLPLEH